MFVNCVAVFVHLGTGKEHATAPSLDTRAALALTATPSLGTAVRGASDVPPGAPTKARKRRRADGANNADVGSCVKRAVSKKLQLTTPDAASAAKRDPDDKGRGVSTEAVCPEAAVHVAGTRVEQLCGWTAETSVAFQANIDARKRAFADSLCNLSGSAHSAAISAALDTAFICGMQCQIHSAAFGRAGGGARRQMSAMPSSSALSASSTSSSSSCSTSSSSSSSSSESE
jgi:hypothetical protein